MLIAEERKQAVMWSGNGKVAKAAGENDRLGYSKVILYYDIISGYHKATAVLKSKPN